MSPSSLFRRVTKYGRSDAPDPRENRLTEVLASVLERVPGLARTLAVAWVDPSQDGAGRRERTADTLEVWQRVTALPDDVLPRVRTQVACMGKFVDLELHFAHGGGTRVDDVVVWVEIKHGGEPDFGQLASYSHALTARGWCGAVVLLDHRRKLPYDAPEQAPEDVPQRSWERTGQTIHEFPARDPVWDWLRRELLSYLQEEDVMDPIALGPEHLCALAFSRQAHAALEEICIRAQPKISRVLDDPETHNARYGEGYWASWPRMPASAVDEGDGAWLEWHILPQDSSGAIEIRAGLSIERHAAFDVELESRLTDVITIGDDERVVFRRWRGPKERLMRVGRPQDVLIGADLDAQADSLACWVTTTLQAVRTVAGLS